MEASQILLEGPRGLLTERIQCPTSEFDLLTSCHLKKHSSGMVVRQVAVYITVGASPGFNSTKSGLLSVLLDGKLTKAGLDDMGKMVEVPIKWGKIVS